MSDEVRGLNFFLFFKIYIVLKDLILSLNENMLWLFSPFQKRGSYAKTKRNDLVGHKMIEGR